MKYGSKALFYQEARSMSLVVRRYYAGQHRRPPSGPRMLVGPPLAPAEATGRLVGQVGMHNGRAGPPGGC
jgi:hypothetical protein